MPRERDILVGCTVLCHLDRVKGSVSLEYKRRKKKNKMSAKSNAGLIYALTILFVAQMLTKVESMKYSPDEAYNDDEDNGKRRSSLAIASAVGEDYGDMSDTEYLRRAIRGLSIDVSYLRRTVRDLYRNDLAAMRKVLDRLVEALAYQPLQPNVLPSRPALGPAQSPMASLLGLGNPGALGGSLLGQGNLGIAQAGGGFGGFGGIAGTPTSLRDEFAQLVDANLAQQTGGQFGQTASLQNQAPTLGQLLSGYKEGPGGNGGLGTGLSPAQNVPAHLLYSRLG